MAAAAQCSFLLCSCGRRPCTTRTPLSLFSPSHFLFPFTATPIRASPKQLKLSTSRTGRVVSAVVSAENTVQSSFSGTDGFKITYLEVTYLEPGQRSDIEARNGSAVKVQATAGPVLGPPWQRPENGEEGKSTLYYEPHCVYNTSSLESERADIVITLVIKQLLPYLGLRTRRCSQLAKLLNTKVIVPMTNGDLDAKGLLASLVSAEGTIGSIKIFSCNIMTIGSCGYFMQDLLSKELPDAQVLQPLLVSRYKSRYVQIFRDMFSADIKTL